MHPPYGGGGIKIAFITVLHYRARPQEKYYGGDAKSLNTTTLAVVVVVTDITHTHTHTDKPTRSRYLIARLRQ